MGEVEVGGAVWGSASISLVHLVNCQILRTEPDSSELSDLMNRYS